MTRTLESWEAELEDELDYLKEAERKLQQAELHVEDCEMEIEETIENIEKLRRTIAELDGDLLPEPVHRDQGTLL